jgi:hypothetical protein
MPRARLAEKQPSEESKPRKSENLSIHRQTYCSPVLEEFRKKYNLSDDDFKELVELLNVPESELPRPFIHHNSQIFVTGGNEGPQSKPESVPRSLDKLDEPEIGSLTVKEFTKVVGHTKDPRKLMLGMSVVDKAEEELQKSIRQYMKEKHRIEPKGKVTLSVIVNKYESVKNGTRYHGYVQASFDGLSRILYSLNNEELNQELYHRGIIRSAPTPQPRGSRSQTGKIIR